MPAGAGLSQIIEGARFDVAKLTFLASVGISPNGVITNTRSGISSLKTMIQRSQSRPVKIGTTGFGSSGHAYWIIFQEELKRIGQSFAMSLVHYGGTSDAIPGLLRGEIDILSSSVTGMLPFVKREADLRFIAVLDNEREKLIPDVRAMSEEGFPDDFVRSMIVISATIRAFFGPPAMSEAARLALERAFANTAKDKEFVDRATKAGHPVSFGVGDVARQFEFRKLLTYSRNATLLVREMRQ
jgi:tripartite-type tricarboxylate transporter receptor subunit TctC